MELERRSSIDSFEWQNLVPLLGSLLIAMFFWHALVPAKVSFHHGKSSVAVETDDSRKCSFAELCKSTVPPCRLNPFLWNGHLQTIWNASPFRKVTVEYRRSNFEQEDPKYRGSFAVDFVVKPGSGPSRRRRNFTDEEFQNFHSEDRRPMLVVLHGLGGGSGELYIRETLASVTRTGEWEACVVISRGCSRSKLTSNLLYNAASTWDVRQSVRWLKRTFPNRPLYGLGFSLGANILTRYVGEEGARCAFKSAIVVSNPWDLNLSNTLLQRSWIGRNVYLRALGASLKILFFKNPEAVNRNPNIDLDAVRKVKYLHDFDRAVQLPMWGYPTVGAYYRNSSSVDALLQVRIPFLAFHAADDPIAVADALPREEFEVSSYAVLCETSRGGHIGWFRLRGERWIVKTVTAFLKEMAAGDLVDDGD